MTPRPSFIAATAFVFLALPSSLTGQDGLGFRLGLGFQGVGSEWGEVLNGSVDGRFASMYSVRGARLGLEWSWASFGVNGAEESWNQTTGRFLLGYGRSLFEGVRPYGEVAFTYRLMHPEGSRFFDDELPREFPEDFHASGRGLDVGVGVEFSVSPRTSLDVSGGYGWFTTDPDPSSFDLGGVRKGSTWRAAVGLTWFPGYARNTSPSTTTDRVTNPGDGPASPDASEPDPWGVEPARGLSISTAIATGLVTPWTWNTFLHDEPWTYVSPRSWWRGVTQGFSWDDNRFDVNHFRHPYHGSLYFNSARSNGFGYWTGILYATVGSYLWECCTETHIASTPDMITTTLGGAAVGEVLYRTASLALDNTAAGSERVVREAVGAILDPPRGITRLLTGRAWRMGNNPPDPLDHVPESLEVFVLSGARHVARRAPASGNSVRPFLGLAVSAGDLFGRQSRPFDFYRARIQFNTGDEMVLGEIQIRGGLWLSETSELGRGESRFSIFQDYDYINTRAYRYAAQSLTGAWLWRVPATERLDVQLNTEASLALLGSVNSEFAAFADIDGIRERVREYDFGFGPAAGMELVLVRDGRRWIEAGYEVQYLSTLNGSNVQGSSSHHLLQFLHLRLHQRLAGRVGLGFDFDMFTQDSEYGFVDFDDSYLSDSRLRLFLSWSPGLR